MSRGAVSHRVQRLRRVTDVSRALTNAASLDEVFELTARRAADLLGADQALLLVTNDDGVLAPRASLGVEPEVVARVHEALDEALVPRLAELLGADPSHVLAVPLVVAGLISGVLIVVRSGRTSVSAQDEWLLSALADQAAVAVEKSHLDDLGVFRERLMAIIGHDLRNPLSTVLMAAEQLLRRDGLGVQETALSRRILRSAEAATRLLDQLLDLTRSRLGGGIVIRPMVCDLAEACHEVVAETELRYPDRALQVEVHGDPTGLWDRDRMYQLLSNLIGNAAQHGAPGAPIAVRIDADESAVDVAITNRGPPIPPATLPIVFEAFRRGRSEPRSRGGLGLGLFIAQEIARAHGGLITATSSEADGTTFRLRIPRRRDPIERAS